MKIIRRRQGTPISYADDGLVRVGDRVEVLCRFCLCFRRRRRGRINYVPNYSLPIEIEINDYGIGVLFDGGDHLWFEVDADSATLPGRVTKLTD